MRWFLIGAAIGFAGWSYVFWRWTNEEYVLLSSPVQPADPKAAPRRF